MLDAFSLFDEPEYNFLQSPWQLNRERKLNLKTDIEMFNEYKDFVKSKDSLVDEYKDTEPYMLSISKDPQPLQEELIVDLDSVPGVLEFRSRFRQFGSGDAAMVGAMDKGSSYNLRSSK